MSTTDKRGKLDAQPFAYRTSKDGKVFLFYEGKQVKVLKGKRGGTLSPPLRLHGASEPEAQLLMAKLTGNFKRGNERRTAFEKDKDVL